MSDFKLNAELLKRDFPAKAMKPLLFGQRRLTTIQAGYITERINDVFGAGQWTFDIIETERIDQEVLVRVCFKPRHTMKIEQYGGAIKIKGASWGDTYKSAVTDALNKCVSYYGIGSSVFKGEVPPEILDKIKKDENDNGSMREDTIKMKNKKKLSLAQTNYIEKLVFSVKTKQPNFNFLNLLSEYDVKSLEDLGINEASNMIKRLQEFQV